MINAEWEVMGKRKGEKMYEYVTKAEYQPVRKEIEAIIQKVRNYMWTHYKVKFQDQLIGSGKRHLITRTVKGNGGYDFAITGYDCLAMDVQTEVIDSLQMMEFVVFPIAIIILLYVVQSPVLLVIPIVNVVCIALISFGLIVLTKRFASESW